MLEDFITNLVDLIVHTETWLDNTENDKERLLSSPLKTDGLKIYVKYRIANKGGGIALVSREKYKVSALTLAELDMFEAQVWTVGVCRDTILTIIGVYRPSYSVRNGNMVTKFLDEFTPWIVDMITNHFNIILIRDFNIHVRDEGDTEVMTFLDTIVALGLEQWVNKPTHRSDNILDLVVLEAECKTKLVRCTTEGFISDHPAIHLTLELKQSTVMRKKEGTYPKLKKLTLICSH